MKQLRLKLRLFVLLSLLLFFSFSAYSQEASEPITAEELQGLSRETLIEIILTYDQNLTKSDQELLTIKETWNSEQAILENDQILLNEDRQRLIVREQELTLLETLFETSLTLQKKQQNQNLIDKILIGVGSGLLGFSAGVLFE